MARRDMATVDLLLLGEDALEMQRDHDVLQRAHERQEVVKLKDVADAVAAQVGEHVVGELAHVLPFEHDLAAGRVIEPTEQVQERGLATPEGPMMVRNSCFLITRSMPRKSGDGITAKEVGLVDVDAFEDDVLVGCFRGLQVGIIGDIGFCHGIFTLRRGVNRQIGYRDNIRGHGVNNVLFSTIVCRNGHYVENRIFAKVEYASHVRLPGLS